MDIRNKTYMNNVEINDSVHRIHFHMPLMNEDYWMCQMQHTSNIITAIEWEESGKIIHINRSVSGNIRNERKTLTY